MSAPAREIPAEEHAAIQVVARFFGLGATSLLGEIRSAVTDAVSDVELHDSKVFTDEAVVEILRGLERDAAGLVSDEGKRISRLAGALTHQLLSQASAQGARLEPRVDELEDEALGRLISAITSTGEGAGLRRIENTAALDNLAELQKKQAELDAARRELAEARATLEGRLQDAPQFQNMQRMLQAKNERIAELEARLGED